MTTTAEAEVVLDEASGCSLPADLPVMNCALCGAVMVSGENWRAGKKARVAVCGGRVRQRPYCRGCYSAVLDWRVRPVPVVPGGDT